jgi:iron complex outermembrane receptor protein
MLCILFSLSEYRRDARPMTLRLAASWWPLLLLALLAVVPGWNQTTLPSVAGTVTDGTGAIVPGATVQLERPGTSASRSTLTNEEGRFAFESLAPGNYRVTVLATGFASLRMPVTVSAEGSESARTLRLTLEPEVFSQNVNVNATRTEIPVTALPASVILLDKESIEQQRVFGEDLASVLENTVPGFGPAMEKLAGRSESLRGRNPLYLINGVPQHNALRDGQRDGHTIDLDFVEQVEVVQGSNSMQGIGATGGVINMVTKAPPLDGRWRQDVRLALTSNDGFQKDGFSQKGSYLLGKRVGKFDFTGGASLMKRDLFYDASGKPIGLYPTQGDLMDSLQRNVYGRAGYAITDTQRLNFSINDFQLTRDGDYVVTLGNRATGLVTSTIPGDPRPLTGTPARNDVTTSTLDYQNQRFAGGQLAVQSFYQNFAALFEGGTFGTFYQLTPGGPPFLDQSEIRSRKLGLKSTYTPTLTALPGFTVRTGFDVMRDRSSQRLARSNRFWVPEMELQGVAPFLQAEQTVGNRLVLTGGLRVERASIQVGDFTTIASSGSAFVRGGSPSYTEVLPNLGASFRIAGGLSAFASYTEGFTMPDVGRVLRAVNVPGLDVDSFLDLKPVVTNNSEYGLKWNSRRVRAQTSYYRSTSSLGAILQADQNGFFNVRREATEIDGMEAMAEVTVHDRVMVGGTYAWLRGRFDSNSDGTPESDLDGSNIAPNRLGMFAQFFPNQWLHARVQVNQLFDRGFAGPGAPRNANFNGYGLVDVLLGFTTRAGVVRFGVENILDKQYLTYFAQTEPFQRTDTIFAGRGRTFSVIFEPRFGRD